MYFENQSQLSSDHGHCFRMSINNVLQREELSIATMKTTLTYLNKNKKHKISSFALGDKKYGWYHDHALSTALHTKKRALRKVIQKRMGKYLLNKKKGRYIVIGEFKQNTAICHAVAVLCDKSLLLDPNKNVIEPLNQTVLDNLFTKIVDVYQIVEAKKQLIM